MLWSPMLHVIFQIVFTFTFGALPILGEANSNENVWQENSDLFTE